MQIQKCQGFNVQFSLNTHFVADNINVSFIIIYVIITAIQLCLYEGLPWALSLFSA